MHMVMVAPTGTQKTTSVVVPTMLTWEHSLIVNDPKGELWGMTAGYRSQFNRCIRLNPTAGDSDRFNPLAQIRLGTEHEVRDVTLVADMLSSPEMESSHSEVSQHFRDLCNVALVTGILHGLYSGAATTLKALDDLFQGENTFEDLLVEMIGTMHTEAGPHPVVLRGIAILKKLADKELSGVCSTVARALQWTMDPLAARMVEASDFTLHDLRDDVRPMTVYLTVPYSDQERLRALMRLLVRQMLDYATQDIGAHAHRMLIILDEAQTLQRMAAIPSLMQFGRGYGLHLMVIVPSLREVERLYGPSHTFIESAHVRLVFAPNDPTVAAQFSRMGGEYRESTGKKQWKDVRLMSETTMMHIPRTQGVLFLGNGGFPAIITKSPYYQHREWAQRASLSV
jgi:type IV secretion system protein VirD4